MPAERRRPLGPGDSAVVTGASRGIGRAIARALVRRGFSVLLVARDAARLAELEHELADAGGSVRSLAIDVTDPGAGDAIRSAALEFRGVPYTVVHNAGVAFPRRFDRADPSEIDRLLSVNVLAPIRITRAVLPDLLERGRGHFLFLGSGAADFPPPRMVTYATSKGALRTFGLALDLETRRRGVRASVLEPIFVRTELGRRPEDPEAPIEVLARRHPRWVLEPEAVARAVLRTLDRPRPRVYVPASWAFARGIALAAGPIVRRRLAVAPPSTKRPEPPAWSLARR